jgi:hypothetical protein
MQSALHAVIGPKKELHDLSGRTAVKYPYEDQRDIDWQGLARNGPQKRNLVGRKSMIISTNDLGEMLASVAYMAVVTKEAMKSLCVRRMAGSFERCEGDDPCFSKFTFSLDSGPCPCFSENAISLSRLGGVKLAFVDGRGIFLVRLQVLTNEPLDFCVCTNAGRPKFIPVHRPEMALQLDAQVGARVVFYRKTILTRIGLMRSPVSISAISTFSIMILPDSSDAVSPVHHR